MNTVYYYCRGCGDYARHSILDANTSGVNHDYTKIQCNHNHEEPFVIEHPKGKPPTQYSRRVEVGEEE